jgi:hypothetical protein
VGRVRKEDEPAELCEAVGEAGKMKIPADCREPDEPAELCEAVGNRPSNARPYKQF